MSRVLSLKDVRQISSGSTPLGVSERLAALYRRALEAGVLDAGSLLLIGDLQELSGCTGLDDASLPLHALLVLMFESLGEGSLCLDLREENLRERCRSYDADATLPARIRLELPRWNALIGSAGDFKPLIMDRESNLLYFQRWFDCERTLEMQLIRLMKSEPMALPDDSRLKTVLADVLEYNPAGFKLDEWQRTALGVALLKDFSILSGGPGTGKTTLVATLLRCMVRLGISVEDIHLAAPTGRAAARMTESLRGVVGSVAERNPNDSVLLNLEAQTLHRLMGYRPSRNDFAHGPRKPLEGRVLVVDEVSMVDVAMMARVLEAAPDGMRVLLVGDREQLPSVEAGAVLGTLLPEAFENGASPVLCARLKTLLGVTVPSPVEPLPAHGHAVVLKAHRRVAKGLQPFVASVRSGQPNSLVQPGDTLQQKDTLHWPSVAEGIAYRWQDLTGMDRENWSALLSDWRRRQWDPAFLSALRDARSSLNFDNAETRRNDEGVRRLDSLFQHLQRAQILTAVRTGLFGCERINAFLADGLQAELDARGPRRFFSGLPILVTRNNYTHRLFNGDTGLVLADREGRYRAIFPQTISESSAPPRRGYQALALDSLAGGWEPAFAITIHKSQGSEFDEILLVVPPLGESDSTDRTARQQRLLTREILYTGLTRARHGATICGTPEALELALSRTIRRASGLRLPQPEPVAPPGFLF